MSAAGKSERLTPLQELEKQHPFGTRKVYGGPDPKFKDTLWTVNSYRISHAGDKKQPELLCAPITREGYHDPSRQEEWLPVSYLYLWGADALVNIKWADGRDPAASAAGDTTDETRRVPRVDPAPDDAAPLVPAPPGGYVDGNPKTIAGSRKPPGGAIPGPALLALGLAMNSGKIKYGLTNWREFPVTTSTYYDAARRHMLEFNDGETFDRESGIHQLGMVMACCAIIIDAMAQGTINDDRTKFPGQTSNLIQAIMNGEDNAICKFR